MSQLLLSTLTVHTVWALCEIYQIKPISGGGPAIKVLAIPHGGMIIILILAHLIAMTRSDGVRRLLGQSWWLRRTLNAMRVTQEFSFSNIFLPL